MGLSLIHSNFCGGLRKTHLFCDRERIGRSRSSKVVDFGTNGKGICDFLLVTLIVTLVISCTVSEISTFWLKITNFSYTTHLTPSLGVNPLEFLDQLFTPKTRVLGLSVGEDFVILACIVFTQCQRVTDRHGRITRL